MSYSAPASAPLPSRAHVVIIGGGGLPVAARQREAAVAAAGTLDQVFLAAESDLPCRCVTMNIPR